MADVGSFLALHPTATAAAVLLMMLTVVSITTFLGSMHVAMMGTGMTKHGDPSIMLPTNIPSCPSRSYLFPKQEVLVGSSRQVF